MDIALEARRRGLDQSILVTRLRFLGDVIITTPVLASLKKRYPGARIFYLAEEGYADILRENPYLDGIISAGRSTADFFRAVSRIREIKPSFALDLFYNPRSAQMLFLAGIPVRIGGARKWRRRLYTHNFSVPTTIRSAVEHHMHAASTLDCSMTDPLPGVWLSDQEKRKGAEYLSTLAGNGGTKRIVAMHPGGTWQAKRWSPASFARLARICMEKYSTGVLLVAGPGEQEIAEKVRDDAGAGVMILPPGPIREAAAVISGCDAVVANDGGIMHMAVALGKPTVGIFGPTEPDIWFPYEGKGPFTVVTRRESCSPCHLHTCHEPRRCLDLITPEEVSGRLLKITGWR